MRERNPLDLPPHAPARRLYGPLFSRPAQAGSLIRKNIDAPNQIRFKNNSRINLVTWVDEAADRMIRETIQRRFPGHDLLTEESVPTDKHARV